MATSSRGSSREPTPRDQEYSAFTEWFLSLDIKIKSAAEVGKRAVDYFRGPDFVALIQRHKEHVVSKFPGVCDGLDLDEEKDVWQLGGRLVKRGILLRAKHQPLDSAAEVEEKNCSGIRKKWPSKLHLSHSTGFDPGSFYIITFEGSKRMQHLLLGGIIGGVLCLCLFPAWPLRIKFAVWYIAVVFLSLTFVLVAVRLVSFAALWFAGADFWIFPNLFDEEASVVDSFRPLYSYVKRDDELSMMAARLLCALLSVAAVYQLGQTHSVSDVGIFAKQSFLDIVDWGLQKLDPPESTDIYHIEPLDDDFGT